MHSMEMNESMHLVNVFYPHCNSSHLRQLMEEQKCEFVQTPSSEMPNIRYSFVMIDPTPVLEV